MNRVSRRSIVSINRFLNTPLGILLGIALLILCLSAYFSVNNARILSNQNALLLGQRTIIDSQSEKMGGLERLTICLFTIHGEFGEVSESDVETCRQTVLELTKDIDATSD